MTESTYVTQHVGFHFAVLFSGLSETSLDAKFQSVSGLEVSLDTETIKEGGENRFEHTVPTRRKNPSLVLKRGLLSPSAMSKLTEWCTKTFEKLEFYPKNLDIILLDENHKPLMKWQIIHAWPKSWKFGELNAERSEVLIETLELNYNRFEFKVP
jgi:phage tail-like protein